MTIRCTKFRPYEKNTLRGFADLELSTIGLVLHDCTLHQKGNSEWVGFPARSYTDKNGNTLWQPLIEFAPKAKAAREQFQKQAVQAIHEASDEEAT